MLTANGINFEWIKSIEDFQCRTNKLKEEAIRMYDNIAQESCISFSKIGQKLANFELKFKTECNLLKVYHLVHTDKLFRDASMEADKILSDLEIDLSMRKDVFEQFVKLKSEHHDTLSGEALRYVNQKIKDGRHNGLHLDEPIRQEVQSISKILSNLKIEFERNLSEENKILEFTEQELSGCSPSFISGLDTSECDQSKKKISLKYPHYFPVIKYARNPETRRQMEFAFNTRCKDQNGPLLKKMISLRRKKAKLLGFETHADHVLSMRMAKDSKTVWNFLQELRRKLRPVQEAELRRLLKYKETLCQELGVEFSGRMDAWDSHFLMTKYVEDQFSLDHEAIREYLPLDTVLKGMFTIYETLLGLRFEVVVAEAWHEDVKLYAAYDAEDGSLLGYFFLDLHPRDGKFGHAQVKLLQLGGLTTSGMGDPVRQVTVVVMMTNFTRPTDSRPALLTHDELNTLFHEFGHVMHGICSQTDLGILIGFNVEWDFIECPSQMLENWCWERESLQLMSGHYETGAPLDGELMSHLLRSRVANVGMLLTRQICLATFDQLIHTGPASSSSSSERERDDDEDGTDPAEVYRTITADYMSVAVTPGTDMPATFGHMAGGYDAQYYGYLWSEVFAADMFVTRFQRDGGLLSPVAGRRYRDLILRPGSSKDACDLIKDFLGREPNQEAFLHLMGLV